MVRNFTVSWSVYNFIINLVFCMIFHEFLLFFLTQPWRLETGKKKPIKVKSLREMRFTK